MLDYYTQENERHPMAYAARCTREEAAVALRKLARHFKLQPITLEWTSGSRHSHAVGTQRIRLNVDGLHWLLVAHEFAHCWDQARRNAKHRKAWDEWRNTPHYERGDPPRMKSTKHHCARHARLVDRTIAYMAKLGWLDGALKNKLDAKATAKAEKEQRAALPPSTDERIAHKERLIANLERKIKMLQTRVKKHRRSIQAIRAWRSTHGATKGETNE